MKSLPTFRSATVIALIALTVIGARASAQRPDRWEDQGVASTGERVYVNLDSIQADARGEGYFFVYQIGEDRPTSFTSCDGRFQVVSGDGVTFEPMIKPQSDATRKMLRRVCTYHLSP